MTATSRPTPTSARPTERTGASPDRRCRWTVGTEPITGAGNVYVNVLDTFVAILPVVPESTYATAHEATRLLARSIVCADRVIDRDVSPDAQRELMLAAQICQLEAIRLLQAIVPLDHPFWIELAARVREFAEACLEESAAEGWHSVDPEAAERIAIGKNAVARLVAPMVCVLGGTMVPASELDGALVDLIVAVQALDDARDWRSDFAARRLSLITARIWSRLGKTASIDDCQRHVHDHAMPEVLSRGRAALSHAIATPVLRASSSWLRLTSKIASGYDHVLAIFH